MKIGNECAAMEEHEPVMYDDKSFLLPIDPSTSAVIITICKHCGCLFVMPKE